MSYNYNIFMHDDLNKDGNPLKIQINTNYREVHGMILTLKKEVSKITPDYPLMKEVCFNLIKRLPLPIHYYNNTFILRARPNENNLIFSRTTEISYNSEFSDYISLGRFNVAKEPVFYGAVPLDSSNANGALTTIAESYKDMYDLNSNVNLKYITIGKWNLIKPITLVMLTFYDVAWKKSTHIQNINPAYTDFLDKAFCKIDSKVCEELFNFFSEAAGKKTDKRNDYLLTNAFYWAVHKYYGNEVGILYSSSMTDNQGLNIVLTKEAVDTSLRLSEVLMYKVERNPNEYKTFSLFPCSNVSSVGRDGKFELKRLF